MNKPENIQEFAEMAIERNQPVNVLFTADLGGVTSLFADGKTIYSIGSEEEEIARTNIRFVRPNRSSEGTVKSPSISYGNMLDACNNVIAKLKRSEKPHLEYLDSQNISYNILEHIDPKYFELHHSVNPNLQSA